MTRGLRIAGLVAGGSVLLAGGVAAQVGGSLDVGAGTYRPDRAIPGGVASIAPTLYFEGESFRVGASGIYTDAPAGRWNFQGASMVQLRAPALGPLRLEATGQVEFTRHFAARGVTAATAELRANVRPIRGTTFWAGQVRGNASTLGSSRPLRPEPRREHRPGRAGGDRPVGRQQHLRAHGWRHPGTGSDTTSTVLPATPEESGQSPATRQMSLTTPCCQTRWRVANVTWTWRSVAGSREHPGAHDLGCPPAGASPPTSPWWRGGRVGSDPVTAVPGSKYLVMGLRLRLGPAIPAAFGPMPKTADNTPFRVGPSLPAGREIIVRAPGASQVELAGDFTDWRPVALQPSGDHGWRAVLPIPPGLHRLAVRFDRAPGAAPPGPGPSATSWRGSHRGQGRVPLMIRAHLARRGRARALQRVHDGFIRELPCDPTTASRPAVHAMSDGSISRSGSPTTTTARGSRPTR
jgi:hypothetical protein